MSREVEQVRGVNASYISFLWREIGIIRDSERKGDYASALAQVTTLIPYLPNGIKAEFRQKAKTIQDTLKIMSKLKLGTDIFTNNLHKHRLMQTVARILLSKFLDELSTNLDKRGVYMERTREVLKGKYGDM